MTRKLPRAAVAHDSRRICDGRLDVPVHVQHLLGSKFELFYFQENPAVEGFFDHALHPGASIQRNAIRVLKRLGYPADIIAEALATVPEDPPGTEHR
jgi:hypothetical protein